MQDLKDSEFMKEALEEAREAKAGGDLPFGAVIVCDGKIVGRGKCEMEQLVMSPITRSY